MLNLPANAIATLTICYESSSGELTQRGVSVTEFDPYQMFGVCHLRDSYRTFLYKRVFSCCDVNTGEVVTDVHQHLMDTYCAMPIYSLDQLERNNRVALQVLLYVAKADGRMSAAERKVMTAACKVLTGDVRITDEMTAKLFRAMKVPSLSTFKKAVGSLASLGDEALSRRLMIACRTIVATEGKVKEAEQEALDYMAKRFAKTE